MADRQILQIIDAALALRASYPRVPAVDVLDLAMQGHRGAHLDTEADGQLWGRRVERHDRHRPPAPRRVG